MVLLHGRRSQHSDTFTNCIYCSLPPEPAKVSSGASSYARKAEAEILEVGVSPPLLLLLATEC